MRSRIPSWLLGLLAAAGGAALFHAGSTELASQRPPKASESMQVRLPMPVQVALAAGDRYLAANINVFRAIVLSTDRLDRGTYHVLGQVQVDAAVLNPAHEDNYYLASAILPWEGEVDAAQTVLKLATDGRPTDPYPPYYYGFNQQYFRGDFMGAARAVEVAAQRVEGGPRLALKNIASKWYERLEDPKLAERTIQSLIASSHDPLLQKHLQRRIVRVRQLASLKSAAQAYRQKTGRVAASLEELVRAGVIDHLPQDPLGDGFRIRNGVVEVDRPGY